MVSTVQDIDQVLGESKGGWRKLSKVATKRDIVIRALKSETSGGEESSHAKS